MGKQKWRALGLVALLLAGACSGASETGDAGESGNGEQGDLTAAATPTPVDFTGLTVPERCVAGAEQTVDLFEDFVAGVPDLTPDEFVALDEVEGLADFQNRVAAVLAETTNEATQLCNLERFQELVAERIDGIERGNNLLSQFLLSVVQTGRQLMTADVAVTPQDDVEAVLNLLDHGSTLTFAAGIYEFERPLLVQRRVALLGPNDAEATLRSSAADAAIVVLGTGELQMRSLAVEHRGAEPASVILAFDRPVDLADVRLSGGTSTADGAAGNGLTLTDTTLAELDRRPWELPRSVVVNSSIEGNEGAGIAVEGQLEPLIDASRIADNGLCGVCFFGDAGGELRGSDVVSNTFGVQVADSASPVVSANSIVESDVAGLVSVGRATPRIVENVVEASGEVGLTIQDESSAMVAANTFRDHGFAISVLSSGAVDLRDNVIDGAEVGIQIDDASAPFVTGTDIAKTSVAGIAVAPAAAGEYRQNRIEPIDGVGLIVESDAGIVVNGLDVTGGAVGLAFGEATSGEFVEVRVVGSGIGMQIEGQARPRIVDFSVTEALSAGVVVRNSSQPDLGSGVIEAPGEVGMAIADDAQPSVSGVTFVDAPIGISALGSSSPALAANRFDAGDVGIQVGGDAVPMIVDNEFIGSAAAALVFIENGSGVVESNEIRDPGLVGVQLGDQAAPTLRSNVFFSSRPDVGPDVSLEQADVVEISPEADAGDAAISSGEAESAVENSSVDTPGGSTGDVDADNSAPADTGDNGLAVDPAPEVVDATVALLYAGEAAGVSEANVVVGFVIGAQVGDDAAPTLRENDFDGGGLDGVGVLWRDGGAGSAIGNTTAAFSVGFQVGDTATPRLESNTVTIARNVAFLVQGQAAPVLVANVCPAEIAGIGLLDNASPELVENSCVEVIGEQ